MQRATIIVIAAANQTTFCIISEIEQNDKIKIKTKYLYSYYWLGHGLILAGQHINVLRIPG